MDVQMSSSQVRRIPPIPVIGDDFSEDEKFRGVTVVMDKAIEALHRDGWSMDRLYRTPNAVLPLPPGKFPPGRTYMFSDGVAVVVNAGNGSVITSLPATAALKTLEQNTPEVLAADEWASRRWAEFLVGSSMEDADLTPRWWKQSWFDRAGSIITVRRNPDGGAKVFKDGVLTASVADDDEADELGLDPITVEMVAYVVEAS
jgi:hypothetical protein